MNRFLITVFLLISHFSFSQNEKPEREPFVLKLVVNKDEFYQQDIKKTPYFVHNDILQIYPGEKLFIEVETLNDSITKMKVVKENLNPDKTIEIEFNQNVWERTNEGMILKVNNPFNKTLIYKAQMFILGRDDLIPTSIIPVSPKISSFELWNDIIISLVLNQWKLE